MFNQSSVYIFGAANQRYPDRILPKTKSENDLYIAADGGLSAMEKAGLVPDIVLGDFDSVPDGLTPDALSKRFEVIKHPVEKDDTDTLLAVKLGFERGYRSFCLYGCLGGERFDHTLATCQTLSYISQRGGTAYAFGEENSSGKVLCVTVIKDRKITFPPDMQGDFSVFADGGESKGVSIKNFKYEAIDVTLSPSFPLGVSNSFIEGKAGEVEVKDGRLLLTYTL